MKAKQYQAWGVKKTVAEWASDSRCPVERDGLYRRLRSNKNGKSLAWVIAAPFRFELRRIPSHPIAVGVPHGAVRVGASNCPRCGFFADLFSGGSMFRVCAECAGGADS